MKTFRNFSRWELANTGMPEMVITWALRMMRSPSVLILPIRLTMGPVIAR